MPLYRLDLQKLARQRLAEAKILLTAKHYPGSYYLAGLAIECGLKACIAKQTSKHEFPDKIRAQNSFHHDLTKLLNQAGLEADMQRAATQLPQLYLNWAVVKDWSIESRYLPGISSNEAAQMFSAISARKVGVLGWIKGYW